MCEYFIYKIVFGLIQRLKFHINKYLLQQRKMSAKSVIQKLQDSELIRLILQFIQNYQLQYEKFSKQISYKCYEATWMLTNIKATGYGRTQSQAYKHALRNLLQLLIQQPCYTQFFIQYVSLPNRPSINKPLSKDYSSHYVRKVPNSKTQGHEVIEVKPQSYDNYTKVNDNYTKVNENYGKNNDNYGKTNDNYGKTNENYGKVNENYGKVNYSYAKTNDNDNYVKKNDGYKKVNQKSEVKLITHQKVQTKTKTNYEQNKQNIMKESTLDKVILNQSNNNFPKNNYHHQYDKHDESSSQQLRKALQRLDQLENYLQNVNSQNQHLKQKLNQINQQQAIKVQDCFMEFKNSLNNQNQSQLNKSLKHKPAIPKLKLQILPNYHKKSEKSLNDSLMNAYNEKRNPSVKKILS